MGAEPIVLPKYKIETTFARRGKNAFKRFMPLFVAFEAVCLCPRLTLSHQERSLFDPVCSRTWKILDLKGFMDVSHCYLYMRCLNCYVPFIECGKAHTDTPLTPLILNGRQVQLRSQWPWAAALYLINGTGTFYAFLCGATLVGDNLLVTGDNLIG